MDQQEIYNNMTKGAWFWGINPKKNTHLIVFADRIDQKVADMNVELNDRSNAMAIQSAVNSTYGKSINPESVEKMYKALEGMIYAYGKFADKKGFDGVFLKNAKDALKAAKLQP